MNKKFIITGASDGLGLELAKQFIKKGYTVISISRSKPTISEIIHIKADLLIEKDIDKAVEIIKSKHSDFSCLINSAGVFSASPVDSLEYQDLENLYKINVLAPMYLTSKLLELIKRNSADIVNIGSTISFKAYESQTAYGSSKWAIRGLNENLRLEFKTSKVRVIGFHPGGFKSKFVEKYTGENWNPHVTDTHDTQLLPGDPVTVDSLTVVGRMRKSNVTVVFSTTKLR